MWLFTAFIFVVAAIASHAAIRRFFSSGNNVVQFIFAGSAIGTALVLHLVARYGWSAETIAIIAIYAFGCELYLFLFAMTITSISANILVRLAKHDLSQAEIDRAYDSEQMVMQRLERLTGAGFLRECQDGVRITAKGSRLLSVLECLRAFFRHSPSDKPHVSR